MAKIESQIAYYSSIYKAMSSSRIKQYFNRMTSDRKCTRHHWSAFWQVNHSCKVELALLDLHHLFPTLVALFGSLSLALLVWLVLLIILPRTRTFISIVPRGSTVKATMLGVGARGWYIRLGSLLLGVTEMKVSGLFIL